MNLSVINQITKSTKRKRLYHFTRVSNLASIAHSNTLVASDVVHPNPHGERRLRKERYEFDGNQATLNAHLRLSSEIMDPDTDVSIFRGFLDQHVFLWPTSHLCQQMLQMYSRREPSEKFAVLELDAYSLLADHFNKVLLSKYNAGSMPRFPKKTSYRKSLRMFLPLNEFGRHKDALVPSIPSEIHEILIYRKISTIRSYLQTIYCTDTTDVPCPWTSLFRPLQENLI